MLVNSYCDHDKGFVNTCCIVCFTECVLNTQSQLVILNMSCIYRSCLDYSRLSFSTFEINVFNFFCMDAALSLLQCTVIIKYGFGIILILKMRMEMIKKCHFERVGAITLRLNS